MTNKLYTGDNLHFLHRFNSASVDLIYLDPPFNSKRMYSAPINSKAAGSRFKDMWSWDDIDEALLETLLTRHPKLGRFIKSVEDIHGKAMMAYVLYMAVRIVEMHRVLKDTGSLYLHCDPTASHYLKLVLDEVFGRDNFINEIVWHYGSWTNAGKMFQRNHDTILLYAKGRGYTFHKQYVSRQNPAPYNIQGGAVNQMLIYRPEETPPEVIEKQRKLGRKIIHVDKGMGEHDVWTYLRLKDMDALQPRSKERTGYPTQKPLNLLHRIINASSNEGDVVLDPFCGCATTCVAAQQLQRKWLAIDIEKQAAGLLQKRLVDAGLSSDFIHEHALPTRTDVPTILPTSKNIRQKLYEKQKGLCKGCGAEFEPRHFELDHIIPKSKGGSDTESNYQLLCADCTRIKGARPMEYLRMRIAQIDEALATPLTFGR